MSDKSYFTGIVASCLMFVKLHHATRCKKSWVHNVWPVQPIIWSNHERWCNWMQPPNHFPWRMWLYPSVIGLLSKLFFVLKQCLKPIDTGANNSVCVYFVSYLPGYGAYYYITPNTGWRRQTKKNNWQKVRVQAWREEEKQFFLGRIGSWLM